MLCEVHWKVGIALPRRAEGPDIHERAWSSNLAMICRCDTLVTELCGSALELTVVAKQRV